MGGFQLLDYSLEGKLYERARTVTYRARRLSDQKKVIVKTVVGEYPDLKALAALQYEYHLLQRLHIPGVIEASKLVKEGNRQILILKNVKGKTLKEWMQGNPVKLEDFFKISLQLVKIVSLLHQQHIIHKDINPSNIIINPKNLNITMMDFNISTELTFETQDIVNTTAFEGNLPYISPEQTGRLNRVLDARTDFYSLGVTFFEMLTGRLPFETSDVLEMVYCHLAELPPKPHDYNSRIPPVLSAIILKLLAKMPEERYQTAERLEADLIECNEQWHHQKKILPFASGHVDINDQLMISQRLYGRDNEIKDLLKVFEQVSKGATKLLLVSGYSGVGKTSLVKEIYKPITRQHGYFISGKYDQIHRVTPYSGFIEAFQTLIRHLLAEPEEKLAQIKRELLKALGNNGRLIEQVIPTISLIIGPQPPLTILSPLEEQNRFISTFQNLIHALAQADHPLVVFLDDLQWIDSASLLLIKILMTDPELHHFLLIGSYRSNEVNIDHPFMTTLMELQKSGLSYHDVILAPLNLTDVNNLLADSLSIDRKKIAELAQLLFAKTEGNPFFLNEFLKKIYQDKLLTFSPIHERWEWSVEKINKQTMTDNVIDLLSDKICQLSYKTQQTLQLAACIGHIFDLQTLSIISSYSLSQIAEHLWVAIQTGLIIPLEEGHSIRLILEDESLFDILDLKNLRFQFIHDKVQQAAYRLVEPEKRQSVHLKIGELLLKEKKLVEQDERLFKVLDHFNQCINLITEPEQKIELAQYNLWAGQKAKRAMACAAANAYFQAGLQLLSPLNWRKNAELIFILNKELATCYYLTGDYEQVQIILNEILPKTKDKIEKLELYKLNCEMLGTLKKHDEALQLGIKALSTVGIYLPTKTKSYHALFAILKIKWQTRGLKIEDIDLPLMDNQLALETSKLMAQMCNSAYFIDQKLMVVLICQLVNISLNYGRWESTPTFFLGYAFIIMHVLGWYKEGLAFTELYKKNRQFYQANAFDGRSHVLLGTCIEPWRSSLENCALILQKGSPLAYESGDLIYATHCLTSLILTIFTLGKSLDEVEKSIQKTLIFIDKINMFDTKNMVLTWNYVVNCLLGKMQFSSDELLAYEQKHLADNNGTQISFYYSLCAKTYYLFGYFDQAQAFGLKNLKYAEYSLGTISHLEALFYYALALCMNKNQPLNEKALNKILKQFKQWADWNPANYLHYLLLLKAEYARAKNDYLLAMDLYDEAIRLAKENGVYSILGMAYECAARFYFEQQKLISAKAYLQNAYYAYQCWGAKAKCQLLEEAYPEMIEQMSEVKPIEMTSPPSNLDLLSIIKTVQTISNEIDPSKLLKKLIRTLLENAGAQKGMLLLNKSGKWWIEAAIEHQDEAILPKLAVERSTILPLSVIHYVQRTLEFVLLNNATHEGDFKEDPYIIQNKPKSILCMPIMQRNEPIAILYLENNAMGGVFIQKHLSFLKLLAGQVAISLENSQLYAAGKRFVPFEFLMQLNKRNLTEISLGDHIQKPLSVLFCDIQGFTRLSEELSTAQNFKLINHFLGLMEPIITRHNGFIDKYIGDAIMALFDHEADSAVKAAISMQKRLQKENKKRIENNKPPIRVGLGINTGELMLGVIGSEHRLENSVIGDTVNVAAHIEHLTRKYGVDLLISGHTKARLVNPEYFHLRQVGTVHLKGKIKPIDIWEVCKLYEPHKRRLIQKTQKIFSEALLTFQNKHFDEAASLFKACLRINPEDSVATYYLRQCKRKL